MSVCLSVRSHISKIASPNFTPFLDTVARSSCSGVAIRLCTFKFGRDVIAEITWRTDTQTNPLVYRPLLVMKYYKNICVLFVGGNIYEQEIPK